ncbi:RNA polymerase, sigma subunit, ECF family [Neorhodopirellula lusitana]|uniref:RNA polymerase, sigma subunit, ECF family n=1 Tax=Neorhodopirellula lusitana TaxID=445327 RepID=A0ABY1PVD1_9BACT|nr:RNA polymerase sigma factor [Neorhodopirellula lusitana]SMP46930.1 RNA polymerase, sigma subunit, ECF family [Neorhodopirellula lusitana]
MNFSPSTLAPEKPNNVTSNVSAKAQAAQTSAGIGSQTGPIESPEITDEQLIARYRESADRAIYETLMRRYEREIYAYLRRYMGNAEMAEDAFQGTFLQVHLKCHQFDPARRFRPWLYAIATNQAIDVQRRNKRHKMVSLDRPAGGQDDDRGGSWSEKLVGAGADPLIEASREENGRWVHEAVETLGEPMQQVVELVYYRGLKYREAADVLGIPVGTVKSRLHAAVHRLTGLWDDSHEGVQE